MRTRSLILTGTVLALAAGGTFAARSGADSPQTASAASAAAQAAPRADEPAAAAPKHDVPKSKDGNLVVALCDGETSMEVAGVKEGETMTREQAQRVADELMQQWREKNPDARWDDQPIQLAQAGGAAPGEGLPDKPDGRVETAPPQPETNAAGEPLGEGAVGAAAIDAPQDQVQTGIYSAYTERDEKIWMAATDKFVQEGHRVFHDAKAFGGTIGVSCDMCHPDAANTHPETYPKFQVQLGRVAMLRDMINWCIENPARGLPLRDDDVRLKAMEAYILAQRKGVPLDYGKH
jgi:thiosulfate dehydrogenase